MECLLLLLAGVFIGWHVPQPAWVKGTVNWLKAKVKNDEESK